MPPASQAWVRGNSSAELPCGIPSVLVDESDAEATVARADALNALGRYDEALRLVSPILAADAEHLGAGLTAGVALINLRREAEGMTLLSRVAATHPSSADALRLLSFAAVRRKDATAAVAWAEQALALAPWSVDAHLQSAQALGLARRPCDAQEAAQRALELAPDSADSHLAMSVALVPPGSAPQRDDLDRAEQHVRQALAIDPGSVAAHNELGRLLLAKNQPFAATSSFTRAVHADPRADVPLANVSRVFARLVLRSHFLLLFLWWLARPVHDVTLSLEPVIVMVALGAAAVVLITVVLLRRAVPRDLPTFVRDFWRRDRLAALWGGCVGLSGLALAVMAFVGNDAVRILHVVAGVSLLVGALLSWARARKAKRVRTDEFHAP